MGGEIKPDSGQATETLAAAELPLHASLTDVSSALPVCLSTASPLLHISFLPRFISHSLPSLCCCTLTRAMAHSSACLREIVDAANGRPFHLYVRIAAQTHITLTVLAAPPAGVGAAASSGGNGTCRSFRGDLSESMQPSALASNVRDSQHWPARVIEALLGSGLHEQSGGGRKEEKYTFELREIAVPTAAPATAPAASAAAADESTASASKRAKKAAPAAAAAAATTTRGELKILYRKSTLIKFPLSYSSDPAAPSIASAASFSSYRIDTLKFLTRVSELTAELNQRLATREASLSSGAAKLSAQLAALQAKVMHKKWMEEGVYAQILALLQTKDNEIAKCKEEQKTCL